MNKTKSPGTRSLRSLLPELTTEPASKLPKPGTKFAALWEVLHRPEGATLAQMVTMTNWQEHSLRGFLAGTLKKRYGLKVVSEKTEAGRVYRATPSV